MENASEEYMEYLRLSELGLTEEANRKLDEAVRIKDPLALHTKGCEAEEDNPPRIKEALKLYKEAALHGFEPSMMNLARYYESQANARWYLHWLKMASDIGSPDAQEELGRPFPYLVSRAISDLESGGAIEPAVFAFRLAARHGNVDAMINLANIYDLKYTPPRRAMAERLYKKAVAKGSKLAELNLERHYYDLEQEKKYVKHSDISSLLSRKLH